MFITQNRINAFLYGFVKRCHWFSLEALLMLPVGLIFYLFTFLSNHLTVWFYRISKAIFNVNVFVILLCLLMLCYGSCTLALWLLKKVRISHTKSKFERIRDCYEERFFKLMGGISGFTAIPFVCFGDIIDAFILILFILIATISPIYIDYDYFEDLEPEKNKTLKSLLLILAVLVMAGGMGNEGYASSIAFISYMSKYYVIPLIILKMGHSIYKRFFSINV